MGSVLKVRDNYIISNRISETKTVFKNSLVISRFSSNDGHTFLWNPVGPGWITTFNILKKIQGLTHSHLFPLSFFTLQTDIHFSHCRLEYCDLVDIWIDKTNLLNQIFSFEHRAGINKGLYFKKKKGKALKTEHCNKNLEQWLKYVCDSGVSALKVSVVKLLIDDLGHGGELNVCSAFVNGACAWHKVKR